jgi:hypothetical protein
MSIDTSPEGLARRKADLIALRDSGAGIWPEDVVLALIDALEEARATNKMLNADRHALEARLEAALKGGEAPANHTQSVDEGPGVQAATGAAP